VVFKQGGTTTGLAHLRDEVGLGRDENGLESVTEPVREFSALGAALVHADDEQLGRVDLSAAGPILSIRPERIFSLPRFTEAVPDELEAVPPFNEAEATWGLQATRVLGCGLSGKDVRVAVLDTGVKSDHPDLVGRIAETAPFVPGALTAADDNGHGTFCAGIVAGAAAPQVPPRYGVAPGVRLYVGKVLDAHGDGRESDILAGIEWALSKECRVISISAGTPPAPQPDAQYEELGRRARALGCLIVAAVGNDSQRPEHVKPVNTPANVSTVVAVGSVTDRLDVAYDSNGGVLPPASVDLVGPGVSVRSAWPRAPGYFVASGTSAATPFVAGVAALLLERDPAQSPAALQESLLGAASMAAGWLARDVGRGLVRAPAPPTPT
jgi:subtilisin family serine protease